MDKVNTHDETPYELGRRLASEAIAKINWPAKHKPMTQDEAKEIFGRVWVYGVDMWGEEEADGLNDAHRRLAELVNEWLDTRSKL